jgi:thiosulfate sulfurtransferase
MQANEMIKLIVDANKDFSNLKCEHNIGNLIVVNGFTNEIKSIKKCYKKCAVCLSKNMPMTIPFLKTCDLGSKNNSISWDAVVRNLSGYKIIDIRSPEHFKLFRVKNSINIPASDLLKDDNIKKIKGFDTPVIVSCYKGITSQEKAKSLNELGIDAYSSYGGIEGFKEYIGFDDLN